MNKDRIEYCFLLLMWCFIIPLSSPIEAQSALNLSGEIFERHTYLEWEVPSGTQASSYRIFKSTDGSTFEEIANVGQNQRSYIDWFGSSDPNVPFQYYVSRVLAGQAFPSEDTLSFEVPIFSDDDWMDMVQKYTFKYFWEFGHPISGMARERNTSGDVVTTGGTGFGIMAMLVAVEREYITRQQALQRVVQIVSFLQFSDTFKGAFSHWINGRTGRALPFSAQDDGADLVETAFLIQGLLAARQYFDSDDQLEEGLRQAITGLYEAVEWSWFRRGTQNILYWHWSPTHEWAMNLPIRGFDEAKMVYLLAVASPTYPVPASLYHQGWAGSNYVNNGIHFGYPIYCGPFAGGPMFFAHYSFIGFDPRGLKDNYCNYFERNRNHALIQQAYAKANPLGHAGYSEECWGITASDNPWGYLAHDLTGSRDNGTIAPTAALSSMPYAPEASMAALKHFYREYGDRLWGPYGFYDAFNLGANWFATSYLAIDQGPIICMIENHRSGLLWDLFMKNPEIAPALEAIGFEEDLTTSTKNIEDEETSMLLYPNPTSENIYISNQATRVISAYAISDLKGKMVHFEKIEQSGIEAVQLQVPTSGLDSGIYILTIYYIDGQVQSQRFLKTQY